MILIIIIISLKGRCESPLRCPDGDISLEGSLFSEKTICLFELCQKIDHFISKKKHNKLMHSINGNIKINENYKDYLKTNLSLYPFNSDMSQDQNCTLYILLSLLNADGDDLFFAYRNTIQNEKIKIIKKYLNECEMKVKYDHGPDCRHIINLAKQIYHENGPEWNQAFVENSLNFDKPIVDELFFLNHANYYTSCCNFQHKVNVLPKHIKKQDIFYELKLIWASIHRSRDFRSQMADCILALKVGRCCTKTKSFFKSCFYSEWDIDLENLPFIKQKWIKEHYIITPRVTKSRLEVKWMRRIKKMGEDIDQKTGYMERKMNMMMKRGLIQTSSADELELNSRFFSKVPKANKELKWVLKPKETEVLFEEDKANLLKENENLKQRIDQMTSIVKDEQKKSAIKDENIPDKELIFKKELEQIKLEHEKEIALIVSKYDGIVGSLNERIKRLEDKLLESNSNSLMSYTSDADSDDVNEANDEKSSKLVKLYNDYRTRRNMKMHLKNMNNLAYIRGATKIRKSEVEYEEETDPAGNWIQLGENTKKAIIDAITNYDVLTIKSCKSDTLQKLNNLVKVSKAEKLLSQFDVEVNGEIHTINIINKFFPKKV